MQFTAIFTPNTLYSNNVLKSNEKTKIRQLFVTAKFFCCESEKKLSATPLPCPCQHHAPATDQLRSLYNICTILVQYMYNCKRTNIVQVLYIYCTYDGVGTLKGRK